MKKGDMSIETIVKLVLAFLALLVIIYFLFFTRDWSIVAVLKTIQIPGGVGYG